MSVEADIAQAGEGKTIFVRHAAGGVIQIIHLTNF